MQCSYRTEDTVVQKGIVADCSTDLLPLKGVRARNTNYPSQSDTGRRILAIWSAVILVEVVEGWTTCDPPHVTRSCQID